jgi:2-hydroxy-6-oxonona-2,4-dienedioate hydrolase
MSTEKECLVEAEERWFAKLGLSVTSRRISLSRPAVSARVLVTGDGPPVLFVHGGGSCASIFAPLLARMTGVRAYAIERPGCGSSDDFDYRGVDLRRHAVDFLDGVLDALDLDRVPIVASSMGGLWALWLALERPSRVSSLALLGCPALLLGTSAPFGMRLLSVPGLNRVLFALEPPSREQARRVLRRMGHDPSTSDPDGLLADVIMAAGRLPGYVTGFATLLERALRLGGTRLPFSAEDLAQVRSPILYVWGERDPFGSVDVARSALRASRDGVLEIVPSGHLPWLDAPDVCAAAIARLLGRDGERAPRSIELA